MANSPTRMNVNAAPVEPETTQRPLAINGTGALVQVDVDLGLGGVPSGGQPGQVVGYDQDGKPVPMNPPSGGASSWNDLQDKPDAFPPVGHSHSWESVSEKPDTFPPSDHDHAWGDVQDKPTAFPPSEHRHNASEIDGLPSAGSSSWGDVQDKPETFPPAEHGHGIGEIDGLTDALDGKQPLTAFKTVGGQSITGEGDIQLPDPYDDAALQDAIAALTASQSGLELRIEALENGVVNSPPTSTAIAAQTGTVGSPYAADFRDNFTDANGDELTFTLEGELPPGVTWTPEDWFGGDFTTAGTWTATITGTDPFGAQASQQITWTIAPAVAPLADLVMENGELMIVNIQPETWPVTFTISEPAAFAGTYTVDDADLADGPHWLVAPGSQQIDSTVTLRPGLPVWLDEMAPVNRRIQWLRGATPETAVAIQGATGETYTIDPAVDGGGNVYPSEIATDAQGRSVTSIGAGVSVSTPIALTGKLWVGHYDDTSVTVTASDVQGADSVRLAATPVGGGATIQTAALAVDTTHRFVKTTITGLAPGVKYTIRLQSAAGQSVGDAGTVTTRPATRQAFRIAFGSCHLSNRGEDAIFDTIIDQNPNMLAFYHLGDRGYPDISTNNVALFHANDDAVMGGSKVARLHRSVPLLYMWDDHDYGANNSGASSASKAAALSWFRARVPMRPYLTGASDSCLFIHSPMPGVTVVMLDPRSGRSSGQIITPADEALLIAQIQATGATTNGVLLFNSGVPWIATADGDTWSDASAQRTRIGAAIAQYAPGRVAIIGGDMHALAYDNGANSTGGAPVLHAGPLAQTGSNKGGPYSSGTPVRVSGNQYAPVDFTPITGGWTLTFLGYSVAATGVQTQQLTYTVNLVAPGQQAPAFTGTSSISGGTAAGDTLTANPGTFSGSPTPTATYQWRMDGVNVSGATGQTFVRPATVGGVPSVVITLSNGVGTAATRTLTAAATTAAGATGEPDTPQSALTDINGQTFQSGEQWTKLGGSGSIPTYSSGSLPGGFAFGRSGTSYYRRGPVDRGPNQYMKAGRWKRDTNNSGVSLCLMMSGDGTTRHELRVDNTSLYIRTHIAGVQTTHQTISLSTIAAGTVCSMEFALIGDILRAWVNGSVVGEHTLAEQHILTSGGTGLASSGTSNTNPIIDIEARNTR